MRNKLEQYIKGSIPANKTVWIKKLCQYCGKPFSVPPCRGGVALYCSHQCVAMETCKRGVSSKWWNGGKVKIKCHWCGNELFRSKNQREKYEKSFCNSDCLTNFQKTIRGKEHFNWGKERPDIKGENNPNWRGGTSILDKARHSDQKYIQWRKQVFARDNYTCQMCNGQHRYIEAHHIKPWRDYPMLRYEVENGITYCLVCHAKNDKFRKLGGGN